MMQLNLNQVDYLQVKNKDGRQDRQVTVGSTKSLDSLYIVYSTTVWTVSSIRHGSCGYKKTETRV